MRIGHGYDIHQFDESAESTSFLLGGIPIPYKFKFLAHSDGDVVIHAICDALLGACALGDIGQHFPDTDPNYKDRESTFFLKKVMEHLLAKAYRVVNVDVTIIAQAPKLMPYLPAMREKLASLLQVSVQDINIKATTHEGLDAIGECRAIGVHAVALIQSSQSP